MVEEIFKQLAKQIAVEVAALVIADVKQTLSTAAQQTSPISTNKFHSEKETAELLGKSIKTLRQYRASGLLHCSRNGKTPVYSDAHIADFRARFDTMPEKKRRQFEASKLELVPTKRIA